MLNGDITGNVDYVILSGVSIANEIEESIKIYLYKDNHIDPSTSLRVTLLAVVLNGDIAGYSD